MDIRETLLASGFAHVAVLDGRACGAGCHRLVLGFAGYEAPAPSAHILEAVVHPYYPVSQAAYQRVRALEREWAAAGLRIRQAPEIYIKPVLNRLPFLRRGRNTLSYLPGVGSRFHVQILACGEDLPITDPLQPAEHGVSCGSCRRCADACPSGAIGESGFDREKCLRFWMMNGQVPPRAIAARMGNRLMGCDECERCCPMNRPGTGAPITLPLRDVVTGQARDRLVPLLGSNYALKNRLVAQGCVMAGSLGRTDLAPEIREIASGHPSPLCRQAAALAAQIMTEAEGAPSGAPPAAEKLYV